MKALPQVNKFVLLTLGAAITLFFLVFAYRYSEYRYSRFAQKEPTTTYNVLAKVGNLMVLPSGTPSIAVISDSAMLKEQSKFFAQAKNGDILIIYPEKVIIFNPTENLLVNVGSSSEKRAVSPIVAPN